MCNVIIEVQSRCPPRMSVAPQKCSDLDSLSAGGEGYNRFSAQACRLKYNQRVVASELKHGYKCVFGCNKELFKYEVAPCFHRRQLVDIERRLI